MGDAMCHMRALKEYKEQNSGMTMDFVTCHYLHYLMAAHTDLFESIKYLDLLNILDLQTKPVSYDKVIQFTVDWQNACTIGILKAWGEKTLGFTPSTDKPYYIVREEEKIIAREHAKTLRERFKKIVVVQLTAPSGYERSFLREDHEKALQLFPKDVGIIYAGPLNIGLNVQPGFDHSNFIVLPGYDVGVMGALLQEVDYVFGAHGGTIMMAHAVGAKNVTQVMFGEGGTVEILKVPEWDNLYYPSHREVDWGELQVCINKRLS